MKVLSLFSGIGAFEKALKNIGQPFELVGFSEIDKYAVKSYCAIHNVEKSKNLGDITKTDENSLPKDIDLITYGFPCQDISLAGKQQGLFNEDGTQTRSGLFFEALRIIEATKPKVAIAENVKNLTSKKFNAQFQIVLASLEAAGYYNYYKVLNAKDFGVPQNRERVFVVSIRKDIDNGMFKFPEGFPLEKRLKDLLEEAVEEKYYLSDKMKDYLFNITENNKARGNGNVYVPTDPDGVSKTITTKEGSRVKDNFVEEPMVMQLGNCCPTKTRKNPNQGRIYDKEGLAPCLNQMGGGNRQPFVMAKEATKKGYAEAFEGDSINLMIKEHNRNARHQQDLLQHKEDICRCIPAGTHGSTPHLTKTVVSDCPLRIRKLTPKECFRLMGFSDEDFEKAKIFNSNTQLYKQAGNSIVVPVVEYI